MSRRRALGTLFLALVVLAVVACRNPLDASRIEQAQDSTAPALSIATPTEGAYFAEQIIVTGSVSDGTGGSISSIRSVRCTLTSAGNTTGAIDVAIAADGGFSFAVSTAAFSNDVTVTMVATDWNDNVGQASVNVRYAGNDIPSFNVVAGSKSVAVTYPEIEGATSYTIYYTTNGATPSPSSALHVTLDEAHPQTPYVISGLKNGNLHAFELVASSGARAWASAVKHAIPLSPFTLAPSLTAHQQSVDVYWPDIRGAEAYRVLRSTSSDGTYADISGPLATNTFVDEAPPRDVELWYRIQPTNAGASESAPAPTRLLNLGGVEERLRSVVPTYNAKAVAYGDPYMYVGVGGFAGDTRRIEIYDVSNPADVRLVATKSLGGTDDVGRNAHVVDGLLFMSLGASTFSPEIWIFDLADPLDPVYLGRITDAMDIAVQGDHAFVLGDQYVRSYDIGDPANPAFIASVQIAAAAHRTAAIYDTLEIWNDTLIATIYVDHHVDAIDISDPANLSVTSQATVQNADEIEVLGDYLYVPEYSNDRIDVFDLNDPLSAGYVGSVAISEPQTIEMSDFYLLAFGSDGLSLIDVTNPTAPVLYETYPDIAGALALYSGNNVAFIPESIYGISIVDVAPPPTINVSDAVTHAFSSDVRSFAVQDGYAYATIPNGIEPYVRVYDVHDRSALIEVGSSTLSDGSPDNGVGQALVVDGTLLYAGNWSADVGKLLIYDIADPTHPVRLSSTNLPTVARGFARYGDYLYVTAENVLVVDISDPATPLIVGVLPLNSEAAGVAVSGPTLFVGGYQGVSPGLYSWDLSSDPASPRALDSYRIDSHPTGDIYVANGYAFALSVQAHGVEIYDVTDPGSIEYVTDLPSLVDGGAAEPSPTGLAVSGGILVYTDWPEESGPADAGFHVHRATDIPSGGTPSEYQFIQTAIDYRVVISSEDLYAYTGSQLTIFPLAQ